MTTVLDTQQQKQYFRRVLLRALFLNNVLTIQLW
nr:MAG TPA: hypothetical protein [Caudoviricetes sp.]DAK08764.1 MAG TPA: hypothetical protein [Caudoviricetes sp.]